MRKIDVCPTPELLHLYNLENKIAVIVDVFRATSCMTTAFAHGIEKIIPVAQIEECKVLQEQGYLAAAERNAMKVEGFDLDNSPFSYMKPDLTGRTLAMTTTNGTLALTKSKSAQQVLIGSFLNRKAITDYLLTQPYDVLVVCAGWKGKYNLEDTLFAGAVVCSLKNEFAIEDDAALAANMIYDAAKYNMIKFIAHSSHVRRLARLNLTRDIEFCLREDLYNVVPILRNGALVKM
ncbi:2-phosphosulfolactate phosphatase [Xanthocytophaga agilis]|uniref:Probable 2-phosphosulfolactate phosphatase n=1 Tax=Xanthocytophaga agilis TaxID=3048010 RepID=A0AAE3R288_9BACT|nr:2-phosphosulfolactate phosphatase [Xanthocytophaga agilis]MDJ1502341.1 2-phosphosulfolactate phosphatase [Xanthocytophaga agilis]